MDEFFPVFADYAARKGLETAVKIFAGRLPDEELRAYEAEYRARVEQVQIGYPPKILSAPGLHAWYPGPLEEDRYWPPFAEYLRVGKGWPNDRVDLLDEASSKIVAFTHKPSQEKFLTKGLIVGYVQSGKTTNFTAVIAKSADVAYRLIIVLSGIHNGLRRQTQERLQEQLLGRREDAWFPLTSSEQDFQKQTVKATAYLQQHSGGTVLCVVKKNPTVLKKLYAWLRPAGEAGLFGNFPVLVIDDEADQASVATKKINPQILKLLRLFPRCTYLGYTATPFANVLIDPAAEDLYPETFILSLPRPDGYFGTERIFGREAVEGEASGPDLDGYDMVRRVPDDTVDRLRPRGRKAAEGFSPTLTDELRAAVRYFWLAGAARRCRGDRDHSTMLIHTSMKTSVHESYLEPLERLRDETAVALASGGGLLRELKEQWEEESRRVPAAQFGNRYVPFAELAPHLGTVVSETKVILDNYRSKDRLHYSESDPVTAIAVGGNTLSRGLTLEGLVVSFFVRAATTYDTLLQMGRWFGFRPGYEDLPRIWMTDQLRSWFRHLATVEHEIRLDIARYEEQELSPREVGVRIRTHPVLNITAKMGAVRTAYASYGGRRVQTRYFPENDGQWLRDNLKAARTLVTDALTSGAVREDRGDGQVLLRGVDVQSVLEFLDRYHVHEDSADLDPRLVRSYIVKENNRADKSLLTWNVAIVGSPARAPEQTVQLGDVGIGTISRSKLKDSGGSKADIKTLMSKEHRVVDMRITAAEARAKTESALVEMRNQDPDLRTRGLLLLYPIRKDSRPDQANERTRVPLDAPEHVMGLALVFPGNAADKVENRYVQVDTGNLAVDPSEYEEQQAALTEDDEQ